MRTTLVTIPVAFALVAAACHHAAPPQVTVEPTPDVNPVAERAPRDSSPPLAEPQRADSGRASQRTTEQIKAILAAMIHFDFDKSAIRPGDAETLDQKVPILRGNPSLRIQIAGNCDERGSDEYNLALGNRRAMAARQYLVSHGVEESRIATISYGKERPLDPGHNEEAWAKKRNDQFSILTANVVVRAARANPGIDMGEERKCRAVYATPPHEPIVTVNSNGTLADVFVYVKSGLPVGVTYPPPATAVTIDQSGCLYHPRVFGVVVGQT